MDAQLGVIANELKKIEELLRIKVELEASAITINEALEKLGYERKGEEYEATNI